MATIGINLKINRLVEEIRKNRVNLGDHHSSEGTVKSGVSQGFVLRHLLFLIFINELADELTCNHLYSTENVKLIAPRRQKHTLRSINPSSIHLVS